MLTPIVGDLLALYSIYLIISGKPFIGLPQFGVAPSRMQRDRRPSLMLNASVWLRAAGALWLIAYATFLLTRNYQSVAIFIIEVASGLTYAIGLFSAFASRRVL